MDEDAPEDTPGSRDPSIDQRAFDYAWKYFSLHAGHRMQAVNFFLIATTFLVGAYVSAMIKGYAGLAAGVSLLGASSSFIFYRIERRVRALIHAAEAALKPIEKTLATSTTNPALGILESVEIAKPDSWSYAKVFRRLYIVVGLGFGAAALYAILSQVSLTPETTSLFPLILRLAAGIVLLLFAFEILAARALAGQLTLSTSIDRATAWGPVVAGWLAAVAGVLVLLSLGLER